MPLRSVSERAASGFKEVFAEALMAPLFGVAFVLLWFAQGEGVIDGYDQFGSVLGRVFWVGLLTMGVTVMFAVFRIPHLVEAWLNVGVRRSARPVRKQLEFWLLFVGESLVAVLSVLWRGGAFGQ
jgi:hypothetical protein